MSAFIIGIPSKNHVIFAAKMRRNDAMERNVRSSRIPLGFGNEWSARKNVENHLLKKKKITTKRRGVGEMGDEKRKERKIG